MPVRRDLGGLPSTAPPTPPPGSIPGGGVVFHAKGDIPNMLHFRSRADAARARLPAAHKRVVLARIDEFLAALAKLACEWDPDDDGHFAYATPEESDAPLESLGWTQRLRDLLPEAVHFHAEAQLWEVIHIPGNNWGWTCFVPDSSALPREVRDWLLANADEADAALARRARP